MRRWAIGALLCAWLAAPCLTTYAQTRLSYGESVEGSLSAAQPEARYLFSRREGDAVLIAVEAAEPEALDPLVMLLDAEQRQVFALDDNSGGAPDARLRHVLPRNGDYLIKVVAAPNSHRTAGAFRLALRLLNPTPTPSPLSDLPRVAPLAAGESIRAELSDGAPFHLYAVYAAAGEPLEFTLRAEQALPIGMYLYSHDFERRLATAELNDVLRAAPAAEGWCWLVVSRIGQVGGSAYTIARAATAPTRPSPAEGVRLVAGLAQTGALSPRFATLYQFEAQRGGRVDLILQAQAAFPALILLTDERFEQVAAGEGTLRNIPLQRSGRYYVIVVRNGGVNEPASGEYTLTLSGALTLPATPTPVLPSVALIRPGETLRGILDDQRFLAYYAFAGARGERAQLVLTAESGTLQPTLYLYVYRGEQPILLGSAAASADDPRRAVLQSILPETARYLIVVARYGVAEGTTQGAYAVTLSLTAP
ncbi:MAG: hypothetical protein J7551_07750 [Chloroflexi bacterium]|nr:hypothetical protein [Chloroflexota bacterium]